MADLNQLSKEAKESFLNCKMEEIRRKNEELKKRYAEVEADKRNAELNSNAAYLKKCTSQGGQPEKSPRPTSIGRGKRLEKVAREKLKAPDFQRRQQRLSEGENPPPDPAYNFLHDRAREGKDAEDRKLNSRRHISNYGGQDFANVRNTMQMRKTHEKEHPLGPPKNKMELTLRMTGRERKEYENWRIEREKIEEDRLARQKTATGEWRREWDKDKIIQEDQDSNWHSNGYRGRGRGGGRNFPRERGGRNFANSHQDSPHPQQWFGRGRGGYQNRRKPQYFNQNETESPLEEGEQLDEKQSLEQYMAERKVQVDQDSLKISFSNDYSNEEANAKAAGKAWAPANQQPRRVGSGRILSTSSQSEDERPNRSENQPYRRGKPSRGRFRGDREDDRAPRNQNRGLKRHQDELQLIPSTSNNISVDDIPKMQEQAPENKTTSDSEKSGSDSALPRFHDDSKEFEEVFETGDESWEDITTSGNESLELSGPVDEGPSCGKNLSNLDTHLEKLEIKEPEMPNDVSETEEEDTCREEINLSIKKLEVCADNVLEKSDLPAAITESVADEINSSISKSEICIDNVLEKSSDLPAEIVESAGDEKEYVDHSGLSSEDAEATTAKDLEDACEMTNLMDNESNSTQENCVEAVAAVATSINSAAVIENLKIDDAVDISTSDFLLSSDQKDCLLNLSNNDEITDQEPDEECSISDTNLDQKMVQQMCVSESNMEYSFESNKNDAKLDEPKETHYNTCPEIDLLVEELKCADAGESPEMITEENIKNDPTTDALKTEPAHDVAIMKEENSVQVKGISDDPQNETSAKQNEKSLDESPKQSTDFLATDNLVKELVDSVAEKM